MRSLRNESSTLAAKRLGAAARKRRKALRVPQGQLAAMAGCSELFVRELEQGKPTVRLDKTLDVLRVLGLELRLVSGRGVLVVDPSLQPDQPLAEAP